MGDLIEHLKKRNQQKLEEAKKNVDNKIQSKLQEKRDGLSGLTGEEASDRVKEKYFKEGFIASFSGHFITPFKKIFADLQKNILAILDKLIQKPSADPKPYDAEALLPFLQDLEKLVKNYWKAINSFVVRAALKFSFSTDTVKKLLDTKLKNALFGDNPLNITFIPFLEKIFECIWKIGDVKWIDNIFPLIKAVFDGLNWFSKLNNFEPKNADELLNHLKNIQQAIKQLMALKIGEDTIHELLSSLDFLKEGKSKPLYAFIYPLVMYLAQKDFNVEKTFKPVVEAYFAYLDAVEKNANQDVVFKKMDEFDNHLSKVLEQKYAGVTGKELFDRAIVAKYAESEEEPSEAIIYFLHHGKATAFVKQSIEDDFKEKIINSVQQMQYSTDLSEEFQKLLLSYLGKMNIQLPMGEACKAFNARFDEAQLCLQLFMQLKQKSETNLSSALHIFMDYYKNGYNFELLLGIVSKIIQSPKPITIDVFAQELKAISVAEDEPKPAPLQEDFTFEEIYLASRNAQLFKLDQVKLKDLLNNTDLAAEEKQFIAMDVLQINNFAEDYAKLSIEELQKMHSEILDDLKKQADGEVTILDCKWFAIARELMYRSSGIFPDFTQLMACIFELRTKGLILSEINMQGKALLAAREWVRSNTVDVLGGTAESLGQDYQSVCNFFKSLQIPSRILSAKDSKPYKGYVNYTTVLERELKMSAENSNEKAQCIFSNDLERYLAEESALNREIILKYFDKLCMILKEHNHDNVEALHNKLFLLRQKLIQESVQIWNEESFNIPSDGRVAAENLLINYPDKLKPIWTSVLAELEVEAKNLSTDDSWIWHWESSQDLTNLIDEEKKNLSVKLPSEHQAEPWMWRPDYLAELNDIRVAAAEEKPTIVAKHIKERFKAFFTGYLFKGFNLQWKETQNLDVAGQDLLNLINYLLKLPRKIDTFEQRRELAFDCLNLYQTMAPYLLTSKNALTEKVNELKACYVDNIKNSMIESLMQQFKWAQEGGRGLRYWFSSSLVRTAMQNIWSLLNLVQRNNSEEAWLDLQNALKTQSIELRGHIMFPGPLNLPAQIEKAYELICQINNDKSKQKNSYQKFHESFSAGGRGEQNPDNVVALQDKKGFYAPRFVVIKSWQEDLAAQEQKLDALINCLKNYEDEPNKVLGNDDVNLPADLKILKGKIVALNALSLSTLSLDKVSLDSPVYKEQQELDTAITKFKELQGLTVNSSNLPESLHPLQQKITRLERELAETKEELDAKTKEEERREKPGLFESMHLKRYSETISEPLKKMTRLHLAVSDAKEEFDGARKAILSNDLKHIKAIAKTSCEAMIANFQQGVANQLLVYQARKQELTKQTKKVAELKQGEEKKSLSR